MPPMYLAGLPISGTDVLELARLVDDPELAGRLETAYGREARILAPRSTSASRSCVPSRTAGRPPPSANFAASCLPNTPAAFATGWRKLRRDPELIGGARCTQSS
jgi:hypothetical protein